MINTLPPSGYPTRARSTPLPLLLGVLVLAAQNAEVEEMRSSMEQMRTIVQIQAQIDSCLVDGGEDGLLLSSSLEGGPGGEADPRLVKQAIRLLRVRHRVLRVRIEISIACVLLTRHCPGTSQHHLISSRAQRRSDGSFLTPSASPPPPTIRHEPGLGL